MGIRNQMGIRYQIVRDESSTLNINIKIDGSTLFHVEHSQLKAKEYA